MLWAAWWAWVAAGLALAVAEVILPGYVFAGFAVGAILAGGLIALGLLGGNLAVLILAFAVMSILAWLGLRRVFGLRGGSVKVWDRDIND